MLNNPIKASENQRSAALELDKKPLFTPEQEAAQKSKEAAFYLVNFKVDSLLTALQGRLDLPEEWKSTLSQAKPMLNAILELAETPDVQWNGVNFIQLVRNHTPKDQG